MKAKHTPYWKFLLGANLFKSYQLDFVEKKGDQITVAVQSGKVCTFRIGEFKGKYILTLVSGYKSHRLNWLGFGFVGFPESVSISSSARGTFANG